MRVDIRVSGKDTEFYLEAKGELRIYHVGRQIAIHAGIGTGQLQSVYVPMVKLEVEAREV